LLERIADLYRVHPRLAVAAPLLRDRHRQWIQARFPQAVFILVNCEEPAWESRLAARTHTISLAYARKVASMNEPITVPHLVLDDSTDGENGLRRQIAAILAPRETGTA